jgi:hypothetical protein
MMRQVARDYSGIPDVRTMTMRDISWFYDDLRAELKQATKSRG